ncbi:oligopeptide transport system permease protein [Clostridium sp. USBA 49]|uniref:ABC transporter permease n=1 Tax=Clostridium TaxID=1485 RepID=UPI00099A9BF0|nr:MULTISPECIES: ABC transporter permease [Clostridium]SKA83729.1 oligopeptide transport system permease protein [Clostridium sp. USBA 49]
MLKFIAKRIGYMFVTLFIIITITFMLMHIMPGDPLTTGQKKLPEQARINFRAKYGLDKSVPEQYLTYIKNVAKGDLGESMVYAGRNVSDVIKEHAPKSARIGIQSIVLGFLLGCILGIIAAFNRGRWPDYLVIFIALLGVSIPSFVVAALLQYTFTVKFKLLPTTGYGSFKYTILPSIAMSFSSIATYARYMRANALDVIGQDYILTAKAKGVSKISLTWKHIIRNAILPAITLLGPQIAGVLTGSFVIETIFSIPGLGSYFVNSVTDRDFTMIMGQTIFVAALYIFSLVIVDIVYGLIDPRIRISGEKK